MSSEKAQIDYLQGQLVEARSKAQESAAVLACIKAGASFRDAGPGVHHVETSLSGPALIQVAASADESIKGYALERNPKRRGEMYRDEIAPIIAKIGGRAFSERLFSTIPHLEKNVEVKAANSLGTLSGALVAQQSLGLLKFQFPLITRVTRDFSNLSAKLNQQVFTRLRTVPSVTAYNPATGYLAASATDTDVSVTISNHKYCQITYNANELANTGRDLFGEQAQGASYAIGLDVMNALYALITPTNYSLGAQKTVQAVGGFNRNTVATMAKAMNLRGAAKDGRSLLLNSDYYQQLGQDAAIVQYDTYNGGQLLRENILPDVSGLFPIEVPNLPTTSFLTGFGLTPEALLIAARVPEDYTKVLAGASYGSTSQVTDPNTDLTLMLTQYVNHDLGNSNYRVALMYGVATGSTAVGQLLTSA